MSKSIGTAVRFGLFISVAAVSTARLPAVEFDGRLPIGKGKLVYQGGDSRQIPSYAGWFLEQFPGVLYVDPLLGTLRYYSPLDTIQLFQPGERGEIGLAEVALRFIQRHREVFGCGAEELAWPPLEVPVDGGNILLVFREHAGTAPIAGATIRMVIGGSTDWGDYGVLKSIKGFTLRDPPGGEQGLYSVDAVRTTLRGLGVEPSRIEGQMYFPRYETSSMTPVWYARGTNAGGDSLACFVDPWSRELLEIREIASELGAVPPRPPEGAVTVTGRVMGISPDPNDPYATADRHSLENGQPQRFPLPGTTLKKLPGWRVGDAVADRKGEYVIEIAEAGDSQLECSLQYGRCHDSGFVWGDDCGSSEFAVFLRVAKRSVSGCDGGYQEVGKDLLRQVKSAGGSSRVDFELGYAGEDPALRLLTSLEIMAFHHLRAAIQDALDAVERNGLVELVGNFRERFPLNVVIPFSVANGQFTDPQPKLLEYHPNGGESRICLTPFLEGGQAVTPTLILHEAAGHHVISSITGAIQTRLLDCRKDCVERSGHPRKVFEGQTLEGFADALAAYQSGISKFGYYREDAPGPLAYDIAVLGDKKTPGGRIPETDRAEVAKALWDLRQAFNRHGEGESARDLLYRYLGRNRTIDERDYLFDPNTLAAELLDILDQPGLTGESDGKKWTVSVLDRELLQAFSGLRIFERGFIRGDANQDLKVDLSDAVSILDHLFNGRRDERCLDAMDPDRDRAVGVTDAVYLLHSFLGGPSPLPPFPRCGVDEEPGGEPISCREYPCW